MLVHTESDKGDRAGRGMSLSCSNTERDVSRPTEWPNEDQEKRPFADGLLSAPAWE
jgi:hypothetical protein